MNEQQPYWAFWVDEDGKPQIASGSTFTELRERHYGRLSVLAVRIQGRPWEDNHGTPLGVLSPAMRMALVAAGVTEGLPDE